MVNRELFRVIDKDARHGYIRFDLSREVEYFGRVKQRFIYCVDRLPFSKIKVEDYLIIDLDQTKNLGGLCNVDDESVVKRLKQSVILRDLGESYAGLSSPSDSSGGGGGSMEIERGGYSDGSTSPHNYRDNWDGFESLPESEVDISDVIELTERTFERNEDEYHADTEYQHADDEYEAYVEMPPYDGGW